MTSEEIKTILTEEWDGWKREMAKRATGYEYDAFNHGVSAALASFAGIVGDVELADKIRTEGREVSRQKL